MREIKDIIFNHDGKYVEDVLVYDKDTVDSEDLSIARGCILISSIKASSLTLAIVLGTDKYDIPSKIAEYLYIHLSQQDVYTLVKTISED